MIRLGYRRRTLRVVLGACAMLLLGMSASADIQNDWSNKDDYHSLTEINTIMNNMAKDWPRHCKVIVLKNATGTADAVTVDGQKIYAIELCKAGIVPKGEMVVTGCQHGCEWPGAEAALRLARCLLSNMDSTKPLSELDKVNWANVKMGTNITIKRVMDNLKIVIVPVVNVDGYKFSWDNQYGSDDIKKYWRKNRRATVKNGQTYYGVELNRNWPWQWYKGSLPGQNDPWPDQLPEYVDGQNPYGTAANSKNVESPRYVGPQAGSEVEVQALKQLFTTRDVIAAIDYHSYADAVLWGPGYTGRKAGSNPPEPDTPRFYRAGNARFLRLQEEETVKDADIMKRTAQKYAEHVSSSGLFDFKASNILYYQTPFPFPCYGSGIDWMYEDNGNKHTLGIGVELGPALCQKNAQGQYVDDPRSYHPKPTDTGYYQIRDGRWVSEPLSFTGYCRQSIPGAIFLASWATDMAQQKKAVTPAKK